MTPPPPRVRLLPSLLAFAPAAALLICYVVLYLGFAGRLIATPFGLDQGEGYDAWSAMILAGGRWPYTNNDAAPYFSSNYPPVWSVLVAAVMLVTGPGLAPARFVATLATLITAALLGGAAYRRARALADLRFGLVAAGGAAGFFLASPYVFHTTPLARVNSLALMFAVLTLTLFERPTRVRIVAGSLVLVAALFTKQTTLDAAAAAIGFAFLAQPRRGAAAAAIVGVLGAVLLVALVAATQGAFWLNVVAANNNPFELEQLGMYLANFGIVHALLLLLAGAEWRDAIREREWSPWMLYFPIALVTALTVGKWGAGESYFLGAIAVTCVLAATRLVRLLQGTRAERRIVAVALTVQLLVLAHGPLTSIPGLADHGPQAMFLGKAHTAAEVAELRKLVDLAASVSGPVLSEEPSIVIAAGKPVIANATQLRNLHDQGRWDSSQLVSDIEARRFGLVILTAQLYPAPVLDAIGQHYTTDDTMKVGSTAYQVMVPRPR